MSKDIILNTEKDIFIYFEGKIYKLFYDENNDLKIRSKKPSEETTNNICLLLHHNKNTKKSGYLIFNKDENINESLILNEATKKLGLLDATAVYLLKTEADNNIIYYYTTKFEIERLFVDFEFSEIFPLEFFFLNIDISGELYGIVSEEFFFLKQFNTYKDLENTTKLFYQTDSFSFVENLTYIVTPKQKRILFSGNINKLYEIHDEQNRKELGSSYVNFNERKFGDEFEDAILLANNLKIFEFSDLISRLKIFSHFKFEDKVSTYYKAKKLKPFLFVFSIFFFSLSAYFSYQFINAQTINYIYSNKIENLKKDIEDTTKTKNISEKKNFIPFYKPLNTEVLYQTIDIVDNLNLDTVSKYNFSFDNNSVNVNIITSDVKNIQYINSLKNLSSLSLKSKKDNEEFEINFSYGKNDKTKTSKKVKK